MNRLNQAFSKLIGLFTQHLQGREPDLKLQQTLNDCFPFDGAEVQSVVRSCHEAIAEGWMSARQAAGIKFGRVLKPSADTHGFSVDVVEMPPLAGPHHRHPNGEIDLIMPLDPGALFDGHPPVGSFTDSGVVTARR